MSDTEYLKKYLPKEKLEYGLKQLKEGKACSVYCW